MRLPIPMLLAIISLCLSSPSLAIEPVDTVQIRSVIDAYYDGMTRGDAEILDRVFHDDWHLKTLGGTDEAPLLVGGKRAYIDMYTGVQQPEYALDRHITSIDIAYNSLAIVRIDQPSKRHTVFFTLCKIKGSWSMISKIFIAEPQAKKFSLAD